MDLKELGFLDIDHSLLQKTKTPYKIYAELLDETAQKQFADVLAQPYVTYGALMPDAHGGYSMPIGGVCATKNVIVPQFVGFDIGCEMCAYQTHYSKNDIEAHSQTIYDEIGKRIPLGFKKHRNQQLLNLNLPLTDLAKHFLDTLGLYQVGTLGGGNHFIEIGYDSSEKAWIVIHSGSRGFGHKIASHYMLQAYQSQNEYEDKLTQLLEDFAKRNEGFIQHNPQGYEKALAKYRLKQIDLLNKKSNLDNLQGIWGLDVDSKLGQEYIMDQNYALEFALENRKKMIASINQILNETLGGDFEFEWENEERFINKNHNHAEFDKNRGEWIHRKGATHASKGMREVIPGNMRDGSFVVVGKGNEDSLSSSSHGAGRVMSRKRAQKSVTLQEFEASMQGIKGTIDEHTLDESPFAYKNIFEVMELQKDLVDVVEHIKVLINVKDNTPSYY